MTLTKIVAMTFRACVYGIALQVFFLTMLHAKESGGIIIENTKGGEQLESVMQGNRITGKVTSSEDGEGLPGVNVIVKGSNQGTVTDVNGDYSLEVPGEESVLVFSSVGFTTEEIVVGNQTTIDLVLSTDMTALDEIVVIGYGTAKKSDLTGSVSSIKSEEITAVPSVRLDNAIMQFTPDALTIHSQCLQTLYIFHPLFQCILDAGQCAGKPQG